MLPYMEFTPQSYPVMSGNIPVPWILLGLVFWHCGSKRYLKPLGFVVYQNMSTYWLSAKKLSQCHKHDRTHIPLSHLFFLDWNVYSFHVNWHVISCPDLEESSGFFLSYYVNVGSLHFFLPRFGDHIATSSGSGSGPGSKQLKKMEQDVKTWPEVVWSTAFE